MHSRFEYVVKTLQLFEMSELQSKLEEAVKTARAPQVVVFAASRDGKRSLTLISAPSLTEP